MLSVFSSDWGDLALLDFAWGNGNKHVFALGKAVMIDQKKKISPSLASEPISLSGLEEHK